jgi:tetratricopeptide (TPR) repeat protein
MTSFLHEGSTLSENKKYPNALSAYQKSLELARQIGDSFTEGQSLSQIGTIETNFLNQHEDAREHLEQALAIWKKINYIEGQQLVLQKLTQVYANIGKNERSDETKKQVSTLQSELMETQAETKTSQKHKLAGSINNYTCNASVFDVQRDNKKISINYNHPIYIGDQIIVKEEGCSITLNLASQKRTLNHNNSGFVVSPNLNVNVEKKKAIFEVVKKWWNGLRRDSDDVDQTIFVAR